MGKKYYGLDIGKFICALLIISSHAAQTGNAEALCAADRRSL